jgi:hypothetical protein
VQALLTGLHTGKGVAWENLGGLASMQTAKGVGMTNHANDLTTIIAPRRRTAAIALGGAINQIRS